MEWGDGNREAAHKLTAQDRCHAAAYASWPMLQAPRETVFQGTAGVRAKTALAGVPWQCTVAVIASVMLGSPAADMQRLLCTGSHQLVPLCCEPVMCGISCSTVQDAEQVQQLRVGAPRAGDTDINLIQYSLPRGVCPTCEPLGVGMGVRPPSTLPVWLLPVARPPADEHEGFVDVSGKWSVYEFHGGKSIWTGTRKVVGSVSISFQERRPLNRH